MVLQINNPESSFLLRSEDARVSAPASPHRRSVRAQPMGRHEFSGLLPHLIFWFSQTADHFIHCLGAIIDIALLTQTIYYVTPHLYTDSDIILSNKDPLEWRFRYCNKQILCFWETFKNQNAPWLYSLGKASRPCNLPRFLKVALYPSLYKVSLQLRLPSLPRNSLGHTWDCYNLVSRVHTLSTTVSIST